jgi:hypothetical protein
VIEGCDVCVAARHLVRRILSFMPIPPYLNVTYSPVLPSVHSSLCQSGFSSAVVSHCAQRATEILDSSSKCAKLTASVSYSFTDQLVIFFGEFWHFLLAHFLWSQNLSDLGFLSSLQVRSSVNAPRCVHGRPISSHCHGCTPGNSLANHGA